MCEKFYDTNCYWYGEMQDMNATIPWCNYDKSSIMTCTRCDGSIRKSMVDDLVKDFLEWRWNAMDIDIRGKLYDGKSFKISY